MAGPGSGDTANPFQAEEGRLALPGDHLDSQPANFVYDAGRLRRIDTEWHAHGLLDFDLVCVRGLFHFSVELLTRGIWARRLGRDGASLIAELAKAAGIADCKRALERLPAAEGELQSLVLQVPAERARADIERVLTSSSEELTPTNEALSVTAMHHDLVAAWAENEKLHEHLERAAAERARLLAHLNELESREAPSLRSAVRRAFGRARAAIGS